MGPIDQRVQLLKQYFFARRDIVAVRQTWTDRKTGEIVSQPRPVIGDQHLDALLTYHVVGPDSGKAPPLHYFNRKTGGQVADGRGFDRVGAYAVAPDDSCIWLCMDFDGPGHPLPLADPQATMLACVERCRTLDIPSHLEKSGSGHGWHLWVFFDAPVPAVDARLLGHFIAPTGHVLATGEAADVRIGRGIECFPKQNTVSDKPFRAGNMLWAPLWFDGKDGGNQFYRIAEDGGLAHYSPDGFERLAVARLQDILAQVPEDIRRHVLKNKGGLKAPSAPKSSPPTAPGKYAPTDADLILSALDHISPDVPYDDWLRIGMALHHWDPQAGLSLWDVWSARGEKYVAGEPPLKWDGFTSGGGVTLGTLFDMAKKAGWEPPAHAHAPLPTDAEIAAFMDVDPATLPVTSAVKALERAEARNDRPRLPTIVVNNRQGPPLIDEAWAAVRGSNYPPRIFQREGALVRLATMDAVPKISAMNFVAVYGHLWRVANWVVEANDMQRATDPPIKVANDMMEYIDQSLPQIESVVSTPVFDASGNLVQSPGYHREARLWLHRPRGFEPAEVPACPTKSQIAKARALLLDDLLTDFPFTADSDQAHAVAALLLPFVRRLIQGPTPLHLVEAPTPGTGKTLLAEAISRIVQAKPAEITTIENDEKENSKKITSLLDVAPQVVLIDNIRVGLRSSQLAAVITSVTWTDRVLGVTRMTSLPNNALWIATANNPSLSLEIARRCIRIRIDPRIDRPWKREGFKHDPLLQWVDRHRADLVHAVLILVRAWVAAGRPDGVRTIGSFESWSRILGGILNVAGIPGFLCNTEELYEMADAEGNEWREFVSAWWDRFGPRFASAPELLALAVDKEMLASVIGDQGSRSQKIRLGRALGTLRDRQFDSYRIKLRRERTAKRWEYGLEQVDEDTRRSASIHPLFPDSPDSRDFSDSNYPGQKSQQNHSAPDSPDSPGSSSQGAPHAHAHAHACENDMDGNYPDYPDYPANVENKGKKRPDSCAKQKDHYPDYPQDIAADLADFDPQEDES